MGEKYPNHLPINIPSEATSECDRKSSMRTEISCGQDGYTSTGTKRKQITVNDKTATMSYDCNDVQRCTTSKVKDEITVVMTDDKGGVGA